MMFVGMWMGCDSDDFQPSPTHNDLLQMYPLLYLHSNIFCVISQLYIMDSILHTNVDQH